MRRKALSAVRWLAFVALNVWAAAAFLLLIGEDDPQNPLSLTAFFAYKALALAALYAAYKVSSVMWRKRFFPPIITGITTRLIQEED